LAAEVVSFEGRAADAGVGGEAAKIAAKLRVKNIALSITHTEEQALAQVIFEQ
jgi:phosphopantetheinyl transferase (holo-ACP synthase)